MTYQCGECETELPPITELDEAWCGNASCPLGPDDGSEEPEDTEDATEDADVSEELASAEPDDERIPDEELAARAPEPDDDLQSDGNL